jgi:hypothetical protein
MNVLQMNANDIKGVLMNMNINEIISILPFFIN